MTGLPIFRIPLRYIFVERRAPLPDKRFLFRFGQRFVRNVPVFLVLIRNNVTVGKVSVRFFEDAFVVEFAQRNIYRRVFLIAIIPALSQAFTQPFRG